jgi:hypothetical protein
MSLGVQILPEFSITQHGKDVKLLYAIKQFFGCGTITKNKDNSISDTSEVVIIYRVRKLEHLNNIIVPFFKKNCLLTYKKFDFNDFADVIELMYTGKHLTSEGLVEIQKIKKRMNRNRKNINNVT